MSPQARQAYYGQYNSPLAQKSAYISAKTASLGSGEHRGYATHAVGHTGHVAGGNVSTRFRLKASEPSGRSCINDLGGAAAQGLPNLG